MSFSWTDNSLTPRLMKMYDAGSDPSDPLEAIGLVLEGWMQQVIAQGGEPAGSFSPWSAAYADRRAAGKILVLDSDLINSAAHYVSGWSVFWGSNKVYAARMHFGWPKGSADETPARPFIVDPDDDTIGEIEGHLIQWAFGEA